LGHQGRWVITFLLGHSILWQISNNENNCFVLWTIEDACN
jgi:hypothetical protein